MLHYIVQRKSFSEVSKILLFAALWTAAEYARTYLFTGFPWNLVGYVWTLSDATLQLASVAGIYGLGWFAVVLATMPALFMHGKQSALWPNLLAVALLVGMANVRCRGALSAIPHS